MFATNAGNSVTYALSDSDNLPISSMPMFILIAIIVAIVSFCIVALAWRQRHRQPIIGKSQVPHFPSSYV